MFSDCIEGYVGMFIGLCPPYRVMFLQVCALFAETGWNQSGLATVILSNQFSQRVSRTKSHQALVRLCLKRDFFPCIFIREP